MFHIQLDRSLEEDCDLTDVSSKSVIQQAHARKQHLLWC